MKPLVEILRPTFCSRHRGDRKLSDGYFSSSLVVRPLRRHPDIPVRNG